MSESLVDVRKQDGVAWLTLNVPPANCYSYELMQALDAAVLDARMDDDVHVIAITGAGDKFFCAGADIGMLNDVTPRFKYMFCLHANETMLRLENTPKLTVAVINGHCVGGGLEVALACDLRIARRDAGKVGLPEVNLGVLPGTGGTQRLTRLLGPAKAIELMAGGDTMGLEQAAELGLVNQVLEATDPDAFREEAAAWLARFVPPGRASKAVGLIKRACQTGSGLPLEQGLALERELQQQLFESDDAREGLAAYKDKRDPEFSGK